MSKPKPCITIVGLGLIGGSIGLALREAGVASVVVGHDKELSASRRAKKLGAVDRTDWNLIAACEGADLIILATPLAAIEKTLTAVAADLKPGCVLMDTAALKAPVLAWAAESLPTEVSFVGGNPIIGKAAQGQGGLEAARADLFRNGLFCLTPSPTADAAAVKLATDLVAILGARPLFLDAAEHDGLLAAVDHLPAVLALVLLDMAIRQPTWRELRKVAGAPFEVGTRLTSPDPTAYSDLFLANRDNVVRWMDTFADSLAALRQALVAGEPEAMTQRFDTLMEERNRWLRDRAEGQWEGEQGEELPRPNFLVDTFLGGMWRKDRGRGR